MVSITGIRSKRMSKKTKLNKGQGLIEFALVLPILVLIVFGVLELGRAFFAFIAISNAAREGARVFTFRPDVATIQNINNAVDYELGNTPLVDPVNIASVEIQCGNAYTTVTTDAVLEACPTEQPIRVIVTYNHSLIMTLFLPNSITLRRSAEMMVP